MSGEAPASASTRAAAATPSDRPGRTGWSPGGVAITALASVAAALAFSSRFGWPWRYHLGHAVWDGSDPLSDPWRMTPPGPSVMFLAFAYIAALTTLWTRADRRRSAAALVPLLWLFGVLLVFATFNWFMTISLAT